MSTRYHSQQTLQDDSKADQDSTHHLNYRQGIAKQFGHAREVMHQSQHQNKTTVPDLQPHNPLIDKIATWNGPYGKCQFPLTHSNPEKTRDEIYTLREELCEARRHLRHVQCVLKRAALHRCLTCTNTKCLVCERC